MLFIALIVKAQGATGGQTDFDVAETMLKVQLTTIPQKQMLQLLHGLAKLE
jgi:hypothetical protein